jgi:hypothetical protein
MTILDAMVDGRAVQYSVVRMLHCLTPYGDALIPNRQGTYYAALCRECGFGAIGLDEDMAAQYMLSTMNGCRHGHEAVQPSARVAFDPQLIDHLYEAYDPQGVRA